MNHVLWCSFSNFQFASQTLLINKAKAYTNIDFKDAIKPSTFLPEIAITIDIENESWLRSKTAGN